MLRNDQKLHALIELNDELENYFSNTIIPQLFVDAHMILRKFTPPAMKQFKLADDFIGQQMEDIKENFRFPTILDNIKMVVSTGKPLEKEIQTTDMRWYQMNILPYIIKKENKTNGVIITFIDITARVKDLEELEKLIGEHELLMDTIAHDIKNPILAMSLTIQMLRRAADKDLNSFSQLLEAADKSLKNMKKVVEDLVDTRWQDHRYNASEELVDIQNILEDVSLTLAPQISESGAIITKQLEAKEIRFVRRKLRSIFYNLLSNAIKYCPPDKNPNILITTYKGNGHIVISIRDNGIGMDAKELDSIFEKFRRIRMTGEGSGVGLYLVNTIVETVGGSIKVHSDISQGSTFEIFLPTGDH